MNDAPIADVQISRRTISRIIDRHSLIIGVFGWLATLIALTVFPVFAPDRRICKGPYGARLACGYIDAPLHTAWGWDNDGRFTISPLFILLIIMGVVFLIAVAMRHWTYATLAIVVSVIWLLLLGLWLYSYLPRPVSTGYVAAVLLASIGSSSIVALNIGLLMISVKRQSR
jgi:hypothetical protein